MSDGASAAPGMDTPPPSPGGPAEAPRLAPRVVGIGASAGGLQAFTDLLQHMPSDSGLAFVLIQHLDPQRPSLLPELLAAHTAMPVRPVTAPLLVAVNEVYLAPPNAALTIAQGVLHLEPPAEARGQRLPIDHFFRSLAADQGPRAVGIVLTGTGADGSEGLAAIKAHGGLTLVQTPTSAAYPAMPRAAIARGVVDHIIELARMPALLLDAGTPALPPPPAPPPDDALAQELQRTRETLEATIGKLQEANLDLTEANEELRTLNEELQAANEELQTSQEEIQSINEALQAVNSELGRKIDELDRANADLANLFASARIPAIFLHPDGRIARFTPQATELFALIDSDIGRPIDDLNARFSNGNLRAQIAQVLQTLTPIEMVVHQPTQDRWWSMHLRPYLTLADRVDGVVLTFADITTLKRAEAVLQSAHDELERRVVARTAELTVANAALQAQVVERARSEQARQQLLQQLVTAQEEERRRVARELHDQLGQDLTALILGLKALQHSISADDAAERVVQLQTLAVQIGQEVRSLAVRLRPSVLDDLGLALALSNYVEQWSARAHVAVDLHTSGLDGGRLPLAVETTIYRLVQEALTNVLKHAQASEVSVIVERHADEVRVIIEDDGVGFVAPATWGELVGAKRLGLIGMRERVALLGGDLVIEAAPGSGTSIFAHLPLPVGAEGGGDADHQGGPGR